MSYEGEMLRSLKMPSKREVEEALLIALFKNKGAIREFGVGQAIVDEIADEFNLSEQQKKAQLETIYKKENRIKRTSLWNRLLFRAADSLAKGHFICRPSETFQLTQKKEWLLTENGFDRALYLLNIPSDRKLELPITSFEVQQVVNELNQFQRPTEYIPFREEEHKATLTKEFSIRKRGFRQAVIEAYGYQCAVCRLKIYSPKNLSWEVEAAHIIPHSYKGRDDILNGIALCRLHHWAFDVGWFSLLDNYLIIVSEKRNSLEMGMGQIGGFSFIESMAMSNVAISLPYNEQIYPHPNAIRWHRENIFNKL